MQNMSVLDTAFLVGIVGVHLWLIWKFAIVPILITGPKKRAANMKKQQIWVYNTSGGYMAKFIGDRKMIETFGTDTMPTGRLSDADPREVVAFIQQTYPECLVAHITGEMIQKIGESTRAHI